MRAEYLKCGFSLGAAAVANISSLMLPLAPYVLLLAYFVAFVVINGGVVLGECLCCSL
jgi:DIE2/ALG10 family